MPIATASSAYVLEDRASPAMQSVRREAERTTLAARSLADEIDRIGDERQRQRLDGFGRKVESLAGSFERTDVRVRSSMKGMEDSIDRSTRRAESRVDDLMLKLYELGSATPKPRVDLQGVAVARAEIADLQHQLNQLGRGTTTMRVRAGMMPGGLAGGGGNVAQSGAYAGTGGAGFFTSRGGMIAGGLLAALPAVQSLGGAAGALAGSLTGATLAGGAGYLTAGGAIGAGLGAIMSVAKPAISSLQNAKKAQDAYNQAVALYGERSKQAKTAKDRLDVSMRNTPRGARELLTRQTQLAQDWRRLTRGSQGDLLGLGSHGLGRLDSAAPQLSGDVRTVTRATRQQGQHLEDFLTGPSMMREYASLTGTFAENLGQAERTGEHLLGTFSHITQATRPFFHEGMIFLDHWTGGWDKGTANISKTRRVIGGFVDDLRAWAHLGGAAFDLVRDLIMPGRVEGRSLVSDLTTQLNTWDEWAKRNPGKIRRFFDDSVRQTEQLAGTVGIIVHDLHEMADILSPVLSRFTQLANVAGGAGLLLPSAIRFGIGRAMGDGGGGGLFGRRGGGGGAGAAATSEATTRGLWLARAGAGGAGAAPGAGAAGPGLFATWRTNAGLQSTAFSDPSYAGRQAAAAELGWRQAAGLTTGNVLRNRLVGGSTYSLARDAGYGRFASAGAQVGALGMSGASKLGGLASSGLMAAGRFLGPMIAIQAALGAAQGSGGMGATGLWRNIASSGTFGLVKSTSQVTAGREARDQQALAGYLQQLGPSDTYGHARSQIGALRGRRARVVQLADERGTPRAERDDLIGKINDEIQARKDLLPQLRAERNALSRQRGTQQGTDVAAAFRSDLRHLGPERAMAELQKNLLGAGGVAGRNFPGARQLAQAGLDAAAAAAKGNPKLQHEYDKLKTSVMSSFDRMGQHVVLVNGKILAASQKDWPRIRDALANPAEQARQRASSAFSAIQRQAIGALQDMGYSSGQARSIVRGAAGKGTGAVSHAVTNAQNTGSQLAQHGNQNFGPMPGSAGPFGARGGRFPGQGLADRVPFGGGVAAPGEMWIANRHTERRLDSMLAAHGTSLAREVLGETTPHGAPIRYARGGPTRPTAGGGALAGVHPGAARAAEQVLSHFPGLSVTSTTGGGHAAGSYHYRGEAVDLGGSPALMDRAAAWVGSTMGANLTEGIHNPNLSIAGGKRVPSSYWGPAVWKEHGNHIHLAVAGALGQLAGVAGGRGLDLGGLAVQHVGLNAPGSGLPGVPGALADTSSLLYTHALQNRLNKRLKASAGLANLAGFTGGGSPNANRTLGRQMMLAEGWGGDQWPSLNYLWTRESGWNEKARNPTSGAEGIPQALGHAEIGDQPAQQIAWGLRYIKGRYGSPAAAAAHERKAGWYERGGIAHGVPWFGSGGDMTARRPTVIGVGDHPRGEDVTVRPRRLGPQRHRSGVGLAGLSVTIQRMNIAYNATGDLKKAVKDELRDAVHELIDELDHGVNADEEALLR